MSSWKQLIANGSGASFPQRDSGVAFKLNDRLFLSNGYVYGGALLRDLWMSDDEAATWSNINNATPYDGYSAIGILGNDIFAIGTRIWKSTNAGISWVDVGAGPLSPVDPEARVIFVGNSFYLVSGLQGVWQSDDLVNWTALAPPPWVGRGAAGIAGFNGRAYLMTGKIAQPNVPPEKGYTNASTVTDVWSMGADEVWRKEPAPPWTGRLWPGLVEGNGFLWMFGGYRNFSSPNVNFAELWRMDSDGNWVYYPVPNGPGPRHAPSLWFSNGRLIVGAGNNNPQGVTQNDVWSLTP